MLIPDGDLILYRFDEIIQKAEVLAISSFKTSFRERFTETPYWKLKLKEQKTTENIKILMITTDNDDESFASNKTHLQNLQNNFDYLITENNLGKSFKYLKKLI